MYSPLAPDPLPPGPQVTHPAAPLLRLLLRVFNAALAALGLLLLGSALWMAEDYKHSSGGGGGGGGDVPSPEFEQAALAAAAAGGLRLLLAASKATAVADFPWFIYTVGLTGVYCFATALCGLAGVKRERRAQLAAHIVLLALLVLAQAVATLLLLTDNAWRARIPDDPSGWWRRVQRFVDADARGVRLGAVCALFAELAVLAAACWLHSIYQAAYEAWLDDREERSERVREALARTVVQTYAGGNGSSWSARLRHKYGVEASQLEAATNAARQTAALQDDLP